MKDYQKFLQEFSYLVNADQLNKLSRNYYIETLEKNEIPREMDLRLLYLEYNLPFLFLEQYFNRSAYKIGKWFTLFRIKKSKKQVAECTKKLNLHRYGVESTTSLSNTQEKMKKTIQEHYGVDNPMKSEIVQAKFRARFLKKYGVNNPGKLPEVHEKMQKTCIERYGVEYANQAEHIRKAVSAKFPQTIEKMKQTCLERYGVEHSFQVIEKREKAKQTCLEKYGNEFYSKSAEYKRRLDEIIQKSYETKKSKHSFAKSKEEDQIFNLLKGRFTEVLRQYRKDSRYPYACDFYIPELDLFIEYQGFVTHGLAPFDNTNDEHLTMLEELKSKNSDFYDAIIYTWTIKDPEKRKTAKQSNLNWIEFFTMKEFMNWYNQTQKV